MLNLLGPYKYIVDAIAIFALIAGAAFAVHKYNSYQQGIGEARVQAQWDKATVAAQAAQRTREISLQKEKDDAIAQATQNHVAALAASNSALASSRVLSSALQAIKSGSATDSIDAARRYTAALADVLNQCQASYRSMAAEADGHASDSLMYQRAWPK